MFRQPGLTHSNSHDANDGANPRIFGSRACTEQGRTRHELQRTRDSVKNLVFVV